VPGKLGPKIMEAQRGPQKRNDGARQKRTAGKGINFRTLGGLGPEGETKGEDRRAQLKQPERGTAWVWGEKKDSKHGQRNWKKKKVEGGWKRWSGHETPRGKGIEG